MEDTNAVEIEPSLLRRADDADLNGVAGAAAEQDARSVEVGSQLAERTVLTTRGAGGDGDGHLLDENLTESTVGGVAVQDLVISSSRGSKRSVLTRFGVCPSSTSRGRQPRRRA